MKTRLKYLTSIATFSMLSFVANAMYDPADGLVSSGALFSEKATEILFPLLLIVSLGLITSSILVLVFLNKSEFRWATKTLKGRSLSADMRKLMIENSELKKKNEELETFSEVAKHSNNGVVIASAEGEIEWISPGFTKITGYTMEKWKAARGNTIFVSSFNMNMTGIANEAIRIKRTVQYQTMIFTKLCKKLWVSVSITPLFNAAGELKKFIIIDTDISAQKEAEEKLKQVQSEGQPINLVTNDIQFSCCE